MGGGAAPRPALGGAMSAPPNLQQATPLRHYPQWRSSPAHRWQRPRPPAQNHARYWTDHAHYYTDHAHRANKARYSAGHAHPHSDHAHLASRPRPFASRHAHLPSDKARHSAKPRPLPYSPPPPSPAHFLTMAAGGGAEEPRRGGAWGGQRVKGAGKRGWVWPMGGRVGRRGRGLGVGPIGVGSFGVGS